MFWWGFALDRGRGGSPWPGGTSRSTFRRRVLCRRWYWDDAVFWCRWNCVSGRWYAIYPLWTSWLQRVCLITYGSISLPLRVRPSLSYHQAYSNRWTASWIAHQLRSSWASPPYLYQRVHQRDTRSFCAVFAICFRSAVYSSWWWVWLWDFVGCCLTSGCAATLY